jgi:hypothetical protein
MQNGYKQVVGMARYLAISGLLGSAILCPTGQNFLFEQGLKLIDFRMFYHVT